MVFVRLGFGLFAGIAIPFMVKDMVYMTIANSFLRPHLRYIIERERMHKDKAVSTTLLDSYLKDVFGSFLLFFVAIGPVVYECYFKRVSAEDEKKIPKKDELGEIDEDKYTKMLKQIKQRKQETAQGESSDAVSRSQEEAVEGGPRITFEEYEAFLNRLDKEKRLEKMELSNPKSQIYHEMMSMDKAGKMERKM